MEGNPKCENCKYYCPDFYATCRRHAPKPKYTDAGHSYTPAWPRVEHNDFCGEYEPIDKHTR